MEVDSLRMSGIVKNWRCSGGRSMGLMGLESGSDKACVCRKFCERERHTEVDDDKDLLMSDYDVKSQEGSTFLI